MSILHAIILGIVQGLTEFLPVSSSGHLALFQSILGVKGDTLFFGLMVHLGTLVAVCSVFFKDIIALFKKPYKNLLQLVVATIPACAVGVLFEGYIDEIFASEEILIYTFLASSILLFVAQRVRRKKQSRYITYPTATFMGLGQALAILPGLSRSGTTMAIGILSGKRREEVAKFSFLMSIPVILGGAILKAISVGISISEGVPLASLGIDIIPTLVASIFAGLSGYVSIKWMLDIVKRCNFTGFSIYLFVLSLVVFVNSYVVSMW